MTSRITSAGQALTRRGLRSARTHAARTRTLAAGQKTNIPPLGETSTPAAYSSLRATPGVCNPSSKKFGLITFPYRTSLKSDAATMPTPKPAAHQIRCDRMRIPVRRPARTSASTPSAAMNGYEVSFVHAAPAAAIPTTKGCAGNRVAAMKQTSSPVASASAAVVRAYHRNGLLRTTTMNAQNHARCPSETGPPSPTPPRLRRRRRSITEESAGARHARLRRSRSRSGQGHVAAAANRPPGSSAPSS